MLFFQISHSLPLIQETWQSNNLILRIQSTMAILFRILHFRLILLAIHLIPYSIRRCTFFI